MPKLVVKSRESDHGLPFKSNIQEMGSQKSPILAWTLHFNIVKESLAIHVLVCDLDSRILPNNYLTIHRVCSHIYILKLITIT